MVQQRENPIANKSYATYIAGLFTEATPLNFPDNTVQFTQNFRYDPAGYIERRLGLEPSECGINTFDEERCVVAQTYRWASVANRKDLDFIAFQHGTKITLNQEVDYDCYQGECVIDLMEHAVTGGEEEVALNLVSFTHGNGSLFVTGRYIQPFRVDYTPSTASTVCDETDPIGCKVTEFDICERDFQGIEDDIPLDEHPTELTDEHLYNLLNRGWSIEHIYQYFDEFGEYPSKAEYHHLGWTTDDDGNEAWEPEEVRTSSTGSSSSPQGHIIRSIFDTCKHDCTYARGEPEEDAERPTVNVIDLDVNCGDSTVIITTETPHGLAPGEILTLTGGNIINNNWCVGGHEGGTDGETWSDTGLQVINLDGDYVNYTIIDPRTIEIVINPECHESNFAGDCLLGGTIETETGQVEVSSVLPENIPCCVETYRPRTNVFFAGRIWHMSLDSDRIGTNVYFSQIIRNHEDEGQAYQDQDPTSRDYNELLKDDGGVISIPEMGRVLEARVMKESLLMFAENGIWSISGSYNNFFDATNYTISKLTDVGCISKKGVVDIEDTIIYASARGIYAVSPQARTQSISEQNIHTKYYNIPLHNKENISIEYHKFDKTLHVLYACDECNYRYSSELILNTRTNAWYEYIYTEQIIIDAFLTGNHHTRGRGINYIVQEGDQVRSYYMTSCEYRDFESRDLADAYLHTAPETLGDLLFKKKINKEYFFFDNIVDSQARINHVWDYRNVDEPCKTEGTLISTDSPCLTVHTEEFVENDGSYKTEEGVTLSIEMASVDDKPLKIYGWSTQFEGVGDYIPGRGTAIRRRDRNLK